MKKIIIIAIIVALVSYWVYSMNTPGKYDAFAKCLKEKGVVFYGAFWCSHCQNQKAEFGKSQKYLPYVECSMPDGKGRTEVCIQKGIEGYPTWEFPDKTRENGELSLKRLSEKSDCPLPQ